MLLVFTLWLFVGVVGSSELDSSFCMPFNTHPIQCEPAEETLQAVTIIFRNGERTPVKDLPEHEHVEFSADGKLSEKGSEGSRQLGSFIKCRYGNFLSTSPSPQVNVTSSNTRPTIDSAAAVIEGLNQSVSIHVIPEDTDNRLLRKESLCPSFANLMRDYRSSVSIQAELVDLLSNATNMEIKSYEDIYQIYETIMSEHCQFDVPLPSWFSALELHPFYRKHFVGWVHGSQTAALYNGPLLWDILTGFMNKSRTMNLYSSHGVTLSAMLDVLGAYESSSPPPYNSFLAIELHQVEFDYEVRILYGGDGTEIPTTLSVPWCQNRCTFPAFTSGIFGLSFDDESWTQACKV